MNRNIFIYGLGSIGQRYARLLRAMYGGEVNLFTKRRRNRNEIIDPSLQSSRHFDPTNFFNIQKVDRFSELPDSLDLSIIASPIHLHISDLIDICEQTNSYLVLLEKPLAGMGSKNYSITNDSNLNKIKSKEIFMSFQSRYSKLYEKLNQEVDALDPKQIYTYRSWFSENLETMHPYEDYRTSHMGNSEQQGDPLSCFSHDIDILVSLMGEAKIINYQEYNCTSLQISTPDYQRITAKIVKDPRIIAQIEMDFIGWPPRRGGELMFKDGRIEWNWLKQELFVTTKSRGIESFNFSDISRDEILIEMLSDILENRDRDSVKAANLEDAMLVNSFIQLAEQERSRYE